MKYILIVTMLAGLFLMNMNQKITANETNTDSKHSDTELLTDIQKKIYSTFIKGITTNSTKPMTDIGDALNEINKKRNSSIIKYWIAYQRYYLSILYIKMGNRDMSEDTIDEAIDTIESIKNKSSDDYALLSIMTGFSLQFKGMKAMFIASSIKKSAKQAIVIDSTNIRAYYAYGSNDYYTPKQYGGGKEAEAYLLKAISLTSKNVNNRYLPSWGEQEAYELLIRLYIRENKQDKAKQYYTIATDKFPENRSISYLANKIKL